MNLATTVQRIIDPYPIEELGNLYKKEDGTPLGRTAIANRMNALGIKSFAQRGHGSRRFISAGDILRLNMLDVYIRENGSMAGFPDVEEQKVALAKQEKPEETSITTNSSSDTCGNGGERSLSLINQAIERYFPTFSILVRELREALKPAPPSAIAQQREVREYLDDAANRSWKLVSSELTPILKLATLPSGDSFERIGYRFTKNGRSGRESLWSVEKL